MKVLFIGGTGIISSACTQLAVERGMELYHLNRGESIGKRPVHGVKHLCGDIRDRASAANAIAGHQFDCVVDWISFTTEHIQANIDLFAGRTKQFIFISSASAYQTPARTLPITERTPLDNPFWEYSRNKIACEHLLHQTHATNGFPYTIVRPSHTYDRTLLPFEGGFTVFKRILDGRPVPMFGDGTSIWTITHHRDFAQGLVGLIGNARAIGEDFHITTNELLTWNGIYETIAALAGKPLVRVYLPSHEYAKYDKKMGDSVVGDKMNSSIFDNSKIKSAVPGFECAIPFAEGAKEVVAWHVEHLCELQADAATDAVFDRMVADWKRY